MRRTRAPGSGPIIPHPGSRIPGVPFAAGLGLFVRRSAGTLPRMLQFRSPFGEHRRVLILLAVLAAVAAGMGCRSSAPASPAEPSPDTWAVVNGEGITREDVDKTFRRTQDLTLPLSAEETLTAKLSLLEELITAMASPAVTAGGAFFWMASRTFS